MPTDGGIHAAGGPFAWTKPIIIRREGELSRLRERYWRALKGSRQIIFVAGRSGIGKTSPCPTIRRHCQGGRQSLAAVGQCVEHYRTGEPHMPILEALSETKSRTCSWTVGRDLEQICAELACLRFHSPLSCTRRTALEQRLRFRIAARFSSYNPSAHRRQPGIPRRDGY